MLTINKTLHCSFRFK